MNDKELISQLRTALSWEIAKPCDNPAYQALLELQRDKDPLHFIHPVGRHDNRYSHLFD